MPTVLGIDIGTTGCKAALVDDRGTAVATQRRTYPLHTPMPDAAELDPHEVWAGVTDAVRTVCATSSADPPSAVAVSVAGEAVTPIGADGMPLGRTVTSVDRRGAAIFQRVRDELGLAALSAPAGVTAQSHYTLFRWIWLAEALPERHARTALLAGHAEWVCLCLGVEPAIDPSVAARTLAFDVERDDWADELMGRVGIARPLLPRVVPSGTILGRVSAPIARDLGLAENAAVVAGGLDHACTALALGLEDRRTAMLGIGTVGVIGMALGAEADFDSATIPAFPHVQAGQRLALAGTPAGGATLAWLGGLLGVEDVEDLTVGAADLEPSVLATPHFLGSRIAFDDPDATAALTGLRFDTGRADIAAGLLTAVAYELTLILERFGDARVEVSTLRAVGGGSRSDDWMQIVADVSGRPVESTRSSFAAAIGAAAIAACAINLDAAWPPGPRVPVERRFEPRPDRHARHVGRLQAFRQLHAALAHIRRSEELDTETMGT